MSFRFIHTADWQLGKPFGGFRPETIHGLQQARLGAISRISAVAQEQGAEHAAVAGDVWDSDLPSDRTVRQPLDAMASASEITWWLLPGNHDPATRGGLWDRLRRGELPSNVRCLCEAQPQEASPGVFFLPAPLVSRNPGLDPTAAMDAMVTPEGALRIGIAHGPTADIGGEGGATIAPGRAELAGLAYLALGDWHGHKKVTERCWYAGTPEPDSFPRNEPGYVLLVEAEAGQVPRVTPISTREYLWQRSDLALTAGEDPVARFEALLTGAHEPAKRLMSLTVTGATGIAERTRLAAHLDREHEERFAHLRWTMDGLHAAMDEAALDALAPEGSLRACADALLARAGEGTDHERVVARRALELMTSFAR